ncbi:MAG: hypothetical protein U1F27_03130 [Turneriella sp.]
MENPVMISVIIGSAEAGFFRQSLTVAKNNWSLFILEISRAHRRDHGMQRYR